MESGDEEQRKPLMKSGRDSSDDGEDRKQRDDRGGPSLSEDEKGERKRTLSDRGTRIIYCIFLVFFFFVCLMARNGVFSFLNKIPAMDTCDGETCKGLTAVYRVGFTLTVFFFILLVLNICPDNERRISVHSRHWILKSLFLVCLLVATFFMPNDIFVSFAYACLFLGAIFVLMQIIVLLEFSYAWNEAWKKKESEKWMALMFAVSILMFSAGIVVVIYMYKWFTTDGDCHLNKFFVSFTLVLGILYTLLSMKVEHGSILPSSVIFVLSCFWTWSALFSEPSDEPCNSLAEDSSGETWQLVVGAFFAGLSLIYTTIRTAESPEAFTLSTVASDDDSVDPPSILKSLTLFYFIMVCAASYMTAIVSNWSLTDTDDVMSVDEGWTSTWVKIIAVWITAVLYVWSLIAPTVCSNRDFGFDMH